MLSDVRRVGRVSAVPPLPLPSLSKSISKSIRGVEAGARPAQPVFARWLAGHGEPLFPSQQDTNCP